jgi:hypothetical protein
MKLRPPASAWESALLEVELSPSTPEWVPSERISLEWATTSAAGVGYGVVRVVPVVESLSKLCRGARQDVSDAAPLKTREGTWRRA